MKSKKAQGLSTSTLVLIVLAVIILVILILGFTVGWKSINPFIKGSNVDDIVLSCESACSLQSKFDYCSALRDLRAVEDTETTELSTTCAVLALDTFSRYGIESCARIECDLLDCSEIRINGVAGNPDLTEGTYDVSSLANEENCFIN